MVSFRRLRYSFRPFASFRHLCYGFTPFASFRYLCYGFTPFASFRYLCYGFTPFFKFLTSSRCLYSFRTTVLLQFYFFVWGIFSCGDFASPGGRLSARRLRGSACLLLASASCLLWGIRVSFAVLFAPSVALLCFSCGGYTPFVEKLHFAVVFFAWVSFSLLLAVDRFFVRADFSLGDSPTSPKTLYFRFLFKKRSIVPKIG